MVCARPFVLRSQRLEIRLLLGTPVSVRTLSVTAVTVIKARRGNHRVAPPGQGNEQRILGNARHARRFDMTQVCSGTQKTSDTSRLSRQPEQRFVRLPAAPAVFGFQPQVPPGTVISVFARTYSEVGKRIRKPPLYPPELRAQVLWWQMLRDVRLQGPTTVKTTA